VLDHKDCLVVSSRVKTIVTATVKGKHQMLVTQYKQQVAAGNLRCRQRTISMCQSWTVLLWRSNYMLQSKPIH